MQEIKGKANSKRNFPIEESVNQFKELKKEFKNPSPHFRSAPFFVWNGAVSREKIEKHLKDFKAQGIGGVFIHPRWGFITEYLGDEYKELVKFTVETASRLGLFTWLYDENSFPSGFAGGLVPEAFPDSVDLPQGIVCKKFSRISDIDRDELFLLGEMTGNQFIKIKTGEWDHQNNKDGLYYAFYYSYMSKGQARFAGFSYVDLLLPKVTETFLGITMKAYEDSVAEYFAREVPGIFTDEPNIRSPLGQGIRFTPDLFEQFEKRYQYNLQDNLLSLFEEYGEWKKVRFDYQKLLLDLFIERWAKPWYEYCEEKNLAWTGHYWEHGWPDPSHNPDNMALYAWHQLPGIDLLFNQFKEDVNSQFGNVRIVKELSSAANQFGRKRTLCESYGASGWELRFEDMKRLGNWMYALGVNFLNQHLSYCDIHGDRKHDFPQSFSAHNSWWEEYHYLADYFARLSAALSAGKQPHDILVLEPTASTWVYFDHQHKTQKSLCLARLFQQLITRLEKLHIEYDLGCERIIQDHGQIVNGKFRINKAEYQTLIIPPGTEVIYNSTADLILEMLAAGAPVYCFSDQEILIEGRQGLFKDRVKPQNWIENCHFYSDDQLIGFFGSKDYQLFAQAEFDKQGNKKEGLLFHQRRELEDGRILFLTNADENDSAAGTARIKGNSLFQLDPHNGELRPYPAKTIQALLEFDYNLFPGEGLLLFASDTAPYQIAEAKMVPRKKPLQAEGPLLSTRLADNVLVLDFCDLEIKGEKLEECFFYQAAETAFVKNGLKNNPWSVSVQFKQEILNKNKGFDEHSGFRCSYYFSIARGFSNFNGFKLAVENPQLYQVEVNQQRVPLLKDEFWLDSALGLFDLSEALKTGQNQITINIDKMDVMAEIDKVFVLGPFDLEAVERGWRIVAERKKRLGSWKWQGCPFYAEKFLYQRNYSLQSGRKYWLKLGKWSGITASVRVNGQDTGIIAWPPYQIEISPFIKDGLNRIELIVYGSLKNLLGPHHNIKQRGMVTPWSFRYAPRKMPPGESYDLIDYGLFEEFSVLGE